MALKLKQKELQKLQNSKNFEQRKLRAILSKVT